MKIPSARHVAFFVAMLFGGAAAAQQAIAPIEGADPPNWDALLRGRTHTPMPTTPAITPADLRTRLYIFADDSMQGRMLATAGNVKAVEYIAREARRLGLVPMGDSGSYFQSLNMVERRFDSTTKLVAGRTEFTPWIDYLPRDQGSGARPLNGARVIFGGTWGDSTSLVDPSLAAGRLVVLRFVPAAVALGPAGGVDRASVSRYFPTAAGIAIASFDLFPRQSIPLYQRPIQTMRDGPDPDRPTFMYISRKTAHALLNADIDSVRIGAAGATVLSTPSFVELPIQFPARNVVAVIPGSDPALRNQYVAIGAHNDHLGQSRRPVAHDSLYIVNRLFRPGGQEDRPPQLTPGQQARVNSVLADVRRRGGGASARPDSIFNGADDDGSGSVAALEIAEYFAAQKTKPKRSLLFVWHVGEEEGLYGSEWFTDHSTVPRDSIVTQLNADMIGRGSAADNTGVTREGRRYTGNPDYVQLIGSRRLSTELGDLAETVNRAQARPLSFDYSMDAQGHPLNIYCRSDHYEYARYGIPVVFFTTGGHADYHQVTDEPQYIDYDRLARVSQFIAALATSVGNLPRAPLVDKPKPDPRGECVQ